MEKRPTNFDNRRGRHGNKVKQTKLPIDFINELGEKRKFGRGRYAALVSKPPIESASLIHLIISLNVTFIFFKKIESISFVRSKMITYVGRDWTSGTRATDP